MPADLAVDAATVLVVEDDPSVAEFVQLQLEKAGFRVDCAGDGREGLFKIYDIQPDVVVLDLSMPRLDGFEVLRQLRAQRAFRDVRVLVLSARSSRLDVIKALDLGADDYMVKPVDGRDLAARVRKLAGPEEEPAWI